MEIVFDTDYALKIEKFIKTFAPFQKLAFCYDYSLNFEHLNEIENAFKNNCISNNFIFGEGFDYDNFNAYLNDGVRLIIFACNSENMLKLKQNVKTDNIKVIYLATELNLCGYMLDGNFFASTENEICILSTPILYKDYGEDIVGPLSFLSGLIMHSFHCIFMAYCLQDNSKIAAEQNKLNALINETEEILLATDYIKKRQLILNFYLSYFGTCTMAVCFHEIACLTNEKLDAMDIINVAQITNFAILFLMSAIKGRNLMIADIYKLKKNCNNNLKIADNFYAIATNKKNQYILNGYSAVFVNNLLKINGVIQKIKTQINEKNYMFEQVPSLKKCNFLLKKVKNYAKFCNSNDLLAYSYYYNIFDKVND